MLDRKRIEELLSRGMPDKQWEGEPMLGAWYTEEEIETAVKAIRDSMDWTKGFGFFCEEITKFEEEFAAWVGTKHAVSIHSAGIGLDMAMIALDLEPGDEVISPALNFCAAHFSILGQRGKIVFCEVDPKTLCADPADVEKRITARTRAILPTHMNGLSADIDALEEVAARHPNPKHGPPKVIGDAARACGGEYKGTKIGKRGWMTVFSFHTMKLMTTLGEGGMITTDDDALAERLRGIRFWGDGKDYWGGSYKTTKVQAAVGSVQLRRLPEMLALRYKRGRERDGMLEGTPGLTLPYEPPGCRHTYYVYTCLVPPEWAGERRDRLMKTLREKYGVGSQVLNPPTYLDRPFIRRATEGQALPFSEELGRRIFCPSLHPLMSEEDNAYVAAAVISSMGEVGGQNPCGVRS